MGLIAKWARDKKLDQSKRKDIKDLPKKFRCNSTFGQEILLFQYVYMYDCYDTIAKNYKETHHLDEQIKKALDIKQVQEQVPVEGKYHVPPVRNDHVKTDQKYADDVQTDDENDEPIKQNKNQRQQVISTA